MTKKGIVISKITDPTRCLQYCQERIDYGRDVPVWEAIIEEISKCWFNKEWMNKKHLQRSLQYFQKCIDRGENRHTNEWFMWQARDKFTVLTDKERIVYLRFQIRSTEDKKLIEKLYNKMRKMCQIMETEEHIINLIKTGSSKGLIRVMQKQLEFYKESS